VKKVLGFALFEAFAHYMATTPVERTQKQKVEFVLKLDP
jgi:hypothetical protein